MSDMRVLIVGAGPTGLTAALEFARQGIKPEVVDAKESPSQLSRAVGILPESIEKLKPSGAGQRILDEGIVFGSLRIHLNNKRLVDVDVSSLLPPDSLPVSMPQDETETIMSDVLRERGVEVKYACKVTNIKNEGEGVAVTFESGESKTYDWVIGADGVNSTVRKSLGIEYAGYELPEVWSIADVEFNPGPDHEEDAFSAWVLDGEEKDIMVMAPIGLNRARLVSSTPDSIAALPIELDITKTRRVGTFKISIRQAEDYVKGRVLLAGDSAHAHSPVGGRGMNLGIDDAVKVVEAILSGNVSEYNRERKEKGRKIIEGTEKIRKTLVSRNPLTEAFVRVVFFLMQNTGFFRRMFLRGITKL